MTCARGSGNDFFRLAVDDAPALVTANVGMAMGAGSNVAVEAGHMVPVRSGPRDVPGIISLSRASSRRMRQKLWWRLATPSSPFRAAGSLAPWGIVLTPAVGARLMSLGTVVVAAAAPLLRRIPIGGSRMRSRSRVRCRPCDAMSSHGGLCRTSLVVATPAALLTVASDGAGRVMRVDTLGWRVTTLGRRASVREQTVRVGIFSG